MVRGADDPLYQRFVSRYTSLQQRSKGDIKEVEYKAYMGKYLSISAKDRTTSADVLPNDNTSSRQLGATSSNPYDPRKKSKRILNFYFDGDYIGCYYTHQIVFKITSVSSKK